jgi:hypothetical protein
MGFEIFIYILRWVTKLIGKICDLPPANPSSYFMTNQSLNSAQHDGKVVGQELITEQWRKVCSRSDFTTPSDPTKG